MPPSTDTMATMRNGEWEGFQRGRDEARTGLTSLVAAYYAGNTDQATVAMIAGALKVMTALTYSRGAMDDYSRSIEPAHHHNRLRKIPCGCQTRVRCDLPGVDPDQLIKDLARPRPRPRPSDRPERLRPRRRRGGRGGRGRRGRTCLGIRPQHHRTTAATEHRAGQTASPLATTWVLTPTSASAATWTVYAAGAVTTVAAISSSRPSIR